MTNNALTVILNELIEATQKHASMHSAHEGYAVLLEEVEEVWDEIKHDNPEGYQAEMIQVGAMALRFLLDVCGMTLEIEEDVNG